jgi:hypothetical protein
MAVGFGFSYGIITAIIFLSTLMQNKIKRYHIINKFNKKTWYLG